MNDEMAGWPKLPDELGTIWDVSKGLARYMPKRIAKREVARLNDATQLYSLICWRIRAILFFYRSIVEACARYPGISKEIGFCLEKLGTLAESEYCRWRSLPRRVFGRKSAQEWFAEKNLPELERALALRSRAPEESK